MLLAAALVFALPASAGKDPALRRAEAFVDKRCPAQYREIATRMWAADLPFNALYGNCLAGEAHLDRSRYAVVLRMHSRPTSTPGGAVR